MENEEAEIVRQAMRIIGSKRSEKKAASSRANGAMRGPTTEETRAKLRESQSARRERERGERMPAEEGSKRPRGRPKKTSEIVENTP